WPVGFLCSGLTGLRRRNIGTGGFEGFLDDDERVFQHWFHDGGHSAALDEDNLDSIARFLVSGEQSEPPPGLTRGKPYFGLLSRLARWLFPVLVLAVLAIAAYAAWTGAWMVLGAIAVGLLVLAGILKVL